MSLKRIGLITHLILTALWAVAIVHCATDKVTAHWHAVNGMLGHHHHDTFAQALSGQDSSNPLTDSHHSEGDHNHTNHHEHSSNDSDCCAQKILTRANSELSKVPVASFHTIFSAVLLNAWIPSPNATYQTNAPEPDRSPKLLKVLLTSIAAPNAPPKAQLA